jgi:hypothetical protein
MLYLCSGAFKGSVRFAAVAILASRNLPASIVIVRGRRSRIVSIQPCAARLTDHQHIIELDEL